MVVEDDQTQKNDSGSAGEQFHDPTDIGFFMVHMLKSNLFPDDHQKNTNKAKKTHELTDKVPRIIPKIHRNGISRVNFLTDDCTKFFVCLAVG